MRCITNEIHGYISNPNKRLMEKLLREVGPFKRRKKMDVKLSESGRKAHAASPCSAKWLQKRESQGGAECLCSSAAIGECGSGLTW